MFKIIVSLKDTDVQKKVLQCLEGAKYAVELLPPLDYDEGVQTLAGKLLPLQAKVVITDYVGDDAMSVKLIQTISEFPDYPEFIFFEDDKATVSREQVLMAINEGARAFLQQDFNSGALLNYVNRAINGPLRLRHQIVESCVESPAVAALEEALGKVRVKADSFQKLIAYLLATPVSVQPRKVLVVSDSPYQLDMLKKLLEEYNFHVLTSSDTTEALNIALTEKPRIVVSDLELENQTGVELCQSIKFTHKLVPCYFVICTANQDKVDKVMVPGNGVDDCLLKAFGAKDVVEFVSRISIGLIL